MTILNAYNDILEKTTDSTRAQLYGDFARHQLRILVKEIKLSMTQKQRIRVIDSHTGGEPTRLVIAGGPDLGEGPLYQRLEKFRKSPQ